MAVIFIFTFSAPWKQLERLCMDHEKQAANPEKGV
jgi:hypothetical protein